MKKRMRKSGALLLCFVICILFLSGCSKDKKAEVPEDTSQTSETVEADSGVVKKSEVKKWSKEYDLKNVVFTDNENYAYTLSEIGIDPDGNARLNMIYENKTDQEITFTCSRVYLNRYECIYISQTEKVAPGETKKSILQIPAENLTSCNITDLEEIKMYYLIDGAALGEKLISEDHTIYPTGLTADTYQPAPHKNPEGSFEMLNNDTITFSIQKVDKNELTGDIRLWYYIECKVDDNPALTIRNFKVNGKDVYYTNGLGYMEEKIRILNYVRINDTGANSMDDIQKIEFDIHTENNGSPYHDHLVYEK